MIGRVQVLLVAPNGCVLIGDIMLLTGLTNGLKMQVVQDPLDDMCVIPNMIQCFCLEPSLVFQHVIVVLFAATSVSAHKQVGVSQFVEPPESNQGLQMARSEERRVGKECA